MSRRTQKIGKSGKHFSWNFDDVFEKSRSVRMLRRLFFQVRSDHLNFVFHTIRILNLKGKHLNQLRFCFKTFRYQICTQGEAFREQNSTELKLVRCDMYP